MNRLIPLMLILFLLPVGSLAEIEVKDSSDYARVLEQGDPALWDEAVVGLIDRNGHLPWKALSTVLPRLDSLAPKTRAMVAEALRRRTIDPRAFHALEKLARDDDPQVRHAAVKALIKGESNDVLAALERLLPEGTGKESDIERRIKDINRRLIEPTEPPRAVKPPEDPAWRLPILVIFSILSGILGVMLFFWGFRLVNLHRLVNNLPRARIASASMGMAVLRGEAQPYREQLLRHPVSREPCLFYPGADKDHRDHKFWIVDGGGRILVEPQRAVFLSEDGILVPGEGVQLLGDIRHTKIDGQKRVTIGKCRQDRHHIERLLHFLLQGVLGRVFSDQSSKALFSDPNSCFWIWDDLDTKPLESSGQLQGLFLAFTFFGSWIMLLVLAAIYLL